MNSKHPIQIGQIGIAQTTAELALARANAAFRAATPHEFQNAGPIGPINAAVVAGPVTATFRAGESLEITFSISMHKDGTTREMTAFTEVDGVDADPGAGVTQTVVGGAFASFSRTILIPMTAGAHTIAVFLTTSFEDTFTIVGAGDVIAVYRIVPTAA